MTNQAMATRRGGRVRSTSAEARPGAEAADPAELDYHIGVTGHRVLGPAEQIARVRAECERIFTEALAAHAEGVVAVSALAEGADSLFANIALEMGIPLLAVVPFTTYEEDFVTQEALGEFHRLRERTVKVETLEFDERSDDAYFAGGKWMVKRSDLVVAIWDEQPARGLGGTADVVAYAREHGKPVIVIHVER